ncbi:hypothetical protein DW068_16595 [Anaerobutyricum hallii]|uniref:Transglutaminase-like domain-containing protein n=1 Tax=Anaerobutyricum hallii TaxID=39488 RepID=A0A415G2S1_9FIRM|nr:leucine-rich repeat protein [Anaerobutyricum hallii]RHK32427.1 hypothetical protein DW068_16595 [Anaerobutyricum hallii]
MRMRKKRWLIPLLVLFIGIILPTKAHAMKLKDTDESIVKWDTVQTKTTALSDTDTLYDYTFEKESYNSYQEAVKDIAKYAIDLVADRKSEHFQGYIPFEIKTTEDISTLKTSDVENQVKQWMMFGDNVTKAEILSFSYSRSGGYENLRSFYTYVTKFSKTDTGYEGIIRVSVNYRFDKDFFQKYETGVQNAVKDMDVAGKSDYDKAYAVCKWIGNRKNIKYNLDYAKNQSGMYAMVERQAVCAGMTKLCNYMGRYVGLDVIDEEGATATDRHAWNLMKIDGEWYYSDPTNCKSDISTYESFLQGYDWLRITTTAIDEAYKDDRDTYKTQDLSYLNNHSSCNGNHVWNKGTPKGSAGCVVPLYFTHECKVCHAVWWEYLADPIGHDYVKYKVTQEATCTKPEITKFVCSRFNDNASLDTCDGYPYMEKETAPALGHDWKDNGDGTATCQRDGCGETHTHIWKKTGTVAATCTDTGKTEYTCTVCGQTKTTTIKALGHKYETVSTDDATCTTPKTVHKECTRCHDKKDETSGEALGHNWRTSSDKNSKTCIRCKTTHIHTWDEGKYSVEPTCKDAGKKLFTCTDCGDTKTVAVKSLGHDYQLVRTDPATCTTPAINHYACSRCGDTVDQEDKDHPALGHDWKKNDDGTVTCQRCGQTHEHKWNTEVISEASCTTDGVTRHTCSICGDTYDDVVKGGHKWTYKKTGTNTSVCLCTVCGKTKEHDFSIFSDKESEKKDPTCTKAGMVVATCADCGRRRWVYDENRPALGHDWKDNGDGTATCQREGCGKSHTHTLDEGEVTKKPSCEEKGVKTYRCTETNCNYTKTEDIAATGHTWDDGKITTKASCDHTGVKTYTCKACGDTRTETIAMLEHTWDDGQVTTKPSCTEKGIRTYTCKVCKATKTEDIEATGHDYKVKDHKDATCTEDGYTTSVCKNCGDEKKETIKATGHDWNKGEVTTKATCTEAGVMTYTCNVCKETKTEEIEATGHQHTEIRDKKDATCTETGYTGDTYCKDCDTKLSDGKEIPATGHQNKEIRDKKAATCTKAGYTGDTYCKDCGELLKTGKETDALGHTWGKGKVTRKSTYTAAGQITYTCSRCGGKRVITTKKLFYPKAGTKYTVAGCQYKVIKAGAEVSLVGTNKNAKSVTIPAVIKVKGVTYKVTSIGAKAFNGSKKLTKVTIGANIKKISNNAFFKCKSLKMVTIKSVLLTKKTANKKAFKGVNKKMVIKVPKKMKKAYVKIFKGLKVK